jgi:hypothetical protein
LNFVDDWRHFGRPRGLAILKDDTLIVADSESNRPIGGPPGARNIFAGLTGGCDMSSSGGCLQKFVKK